LAHARDSEGPSTGPRAGRLQRAAEEEEEEEEEEEGMNAEEAGAE
jgi:hypothetical protein